MDDARAPASPDWVRAAFVQAREELWLFALTLVRFTRHPGRFTREWTRGELRALNPFGFAVTAVGALGAIQALGAGLGLDYGSEHATLATQIASAILPSVYYAALGVVTHALLRLLGSRRKLRDTVGVALYAVGPALATYAVLIVVALVYFWTHHYSINRNQWIAFPLATLALVAFIVPFVIALHELHAFERASWMRVVAAFLVALVLSGFFFGEVDPPGSYGEHPEIQLQHDAKGYHLGSWGIGDG